MSVLCLSMEYRHTQTTQSVRANADEGLQSVRANAEKGLQSVRANAEEGLHTQGNRHVQTYMRM